VALVLATLYVRTAYISLPCAIANIALYETSVRRYHAHLAWVLFTSFRVCLY
jgi:hypothetical protein